jgi:dTDP-4-dehydrorhamnose reductase
MSGDTIWITGATGLLGRALYKSFSEGLNGKTIGTGFSRARDPIRKLDLLDTEEVISFVRKHTPRFILHSAAERRPDVSEKDPEFTRKLNVETTQLLAELAKEINAWILYISTDYVFDGTTPPYQPGDIPNPLNHYGRSKLDGENAIREVTDNFGVLRVPILYGDVENLAESAVTSIAPLLTHSPIPPQDHWAIRYPTHVEDVATVCLQMVDYKSYEERFRGIFHWSGDEPFTKYEMACAMAPVLSVDTEDIPAAPEPSPGTPRPQDCCLDMTELSALGFGSQRSFSEAISGILSKHNV